MSAYHRRIYGVPPEHEETFTADLWARGALGCEIRDHGEIVAYFPDPPPEALLAWDLAEWRGRGVESGAQEALEERDWLAEYRSRASPIEVGRRFLVDPGDAADASTVRSQGRWLLRIPARTAFGTGSHESTSLAVEWLEDLDLRGLDVLDGGTGSGILAFVALKLGARRATGFDIDPASALVARQNGELNRGELRDLRPQFFAGRPAALRDVARFDLAVVNVLTSLGLTSAGEKRRGEWVAFLLQARRDSPLTRRNP